MQKSPSHFVGHIDQFSITIFLVKTKTMNRTDCANRMSTQPCFREFQLRIDLSYFPFSSLFSISYPQFWTQPDCRKLLQLAFECFWWLYRIFSGKWMKMESRWISDNPHSRRQTTTMTKSLLHRQYRQCRRSHPKLPRWLKKSKGYNLHWALNYRIYRYLYYKPIFIGLMFTNFANELGHHLGPSFFMGLSSSPRNPLFNHVPLLQI